MGPEFRFTDDLDLCKRFYNLRSFNNVVIAVSGGSDSLALLHLAYLWHTKTLKKHRLRLICVTINHGLREEAKSEMLQVREWTIALGVEHRSINWQGKKPISAIQDYARTARYQLLKDLVFRLPGKSIVLTGHTCDDQAETLLMRLARGSGVEGIAGIAKSTSMYGYSLLRPLLDLSRAELQRYLKSNKTIWLNDPSNESLAFERVRIRKQLPSRKALGLGNIALSRTAVRMARANSALDQITDQILRDIVLNNSNLTRYGIFTWEYNYQELPHEIAIRILRRVIHLLGGQKDVPSLNKTEKLFLNISMDQFRGATLAGCRVFREKIQNRSHILIFREKGRFGLPCLKFHHAPKTITWDRRFRIRLGKIEGKEISIEAVGSNLSILRKTCKSIGADNYQIPSVALTTLPGLYIESEIVAVPNLEWGLNGYQVVSEFLIDKLFVK